MIRAAFALFVALCMPAAAQFSSPMVPFGGGSSSLGTRYYFANAGSDTTNDCKTQATPCRTVGKANGLSYVAADSINFKGGDNFTDACLTLTNTNVTATAVHPVLVTNYGAGAFTITPPCTGNTAAITIDGASVQVANCILVGPSPTLLRAGIWFKNTALSTPLAGAGVQNCDIGGFTYEPTDFGADIFITGFPGNGLSGCQILNNTLHGLSGVTSVEDNGVSGFGNGTNINCTIQGNIVFNIGGNSDGAQPGSQGSGMQIQGHTGSRAQFNIAHDIGGNTVTCGGPTGQWMSGSTNSIILFGESYFVRPAGMVPGNVVSTQAGCDWEGFDIDVGTVNDVVEYTYSHDNGGAGYLMFYDGGTWGPNTTRYNVTENDNGLGYLGFGCFSILASSNISVPVFDIYNNTCWNNITYVGNTPPFNGNKGAPIFGIQLAGAFGGYIANNIGVSRQTTVPGPFYAIYGNEPGGAATAAVKFFNNQYYSLNGGGAQYLWFNTAYSDQGTFNALTGQEAGSFNFNPPFTGAGGTGGTCAWTPSSTTSWPPGGCPTPYTLQSGSQQNYLLLADGVTHLFLVDGMTSLCTEPACVVNYRSNGVDLTAAPYSLSVGARDYYANAIPGPGPCYNVGGFGLCP